MEEKSVVTMTYQTPCGELLLGTTSGALIQADWVAGWHEATVRARLNRYLGNPVFESGTDPVLEETASQLDDYFAGKRKSFDLPLSSYDYSNPIFLIFAHNSNVSIGDRQDHSNLSF